jgi:hypothetical protein
LALGALLALRHAVSLFIPWYATGPRAIIAAPKRRSPVPCELPEPTFLPALARGQLLALVRDALESANATPSRKRLELVPA